VPGNGDLIEFTLSRTGRTRNFGGGIAFVQFLDSTTGPSRRGQFLDTSLDAAFSEGDAVPSDSQRCDGGSPRRGRRLESYRRLAASYRHRGNSTGFSS
jgi:hypothetical protein